MNRTDTITNHLQVNLEGPGNIVLEIELREGGARAAIFQMNLYSGEGSKKRYLWVLSIDHRPPVCFRSGFMGVVPDRILDLNAGLMRPLGQINRFRKAMVESLPELSCRALDADLGIGNNNEASGPVFRIF